MSETYLPIKWKALALALFAIVYSLPCEEICGYDNEYAHQAINGNSIQQSVHLTNSLKRLGYKSSDQAIDKKAIWQWFIVGAKQEDIPLNRTINHFHNPLKPWLSAGLGGNRPGSAYWALNQDVLGIEDRSWKKARTTFYEGLTLNNKDIREKKLAYSLQSLGQVMHLLSDVSVPAHVRNDPHVMPDYLGGYTYESWAKANWRDAANKGYFTGKRVDPVIFNKAVENEIVKSPTTALWDQDVYRRDGSNPEVTWTTNPIISGYGLSEYTNANFFSEDTIFADFAHPAVEKTTAKLVEGYARNGDKYKTWYIMGYQSEQLAALSYLWNGASRRWTYHLDDNVYNNYASNLLPRAVGFSTALVDYFFRGDIRLDYNPDARDGYRIKSNTDERIEGEFSIRYDTANDDRWQLWKSKGWMKPDGDWAGGIDFFPPADAKDPGKYIVVFKGKMGNEEGAVAGYVTQPLQITPPARFVYSFIGPEADPQQFTELSVRILNKSTETIGSGTLQAVVKYRKSVDDARYSYAVSEAKGAEGLDQGAEFSFNFSQDPIPLDATDVYLIVVFKGKIGEEPNAVAMGERDISEPTPIDFFNNMDKVCINGTWYEAGSQEAQDAIDLNNDGTIDEGDIWPHPIENAYLKLSSLSDARDASAEDYTFHIADMPPGGFYRGHVLSDYNAMMSSSVTKVTIVEFKDGWGHLISRDKWPGTARKKQKEVHGELGYCQAEGFSTLPCLVTKVESYYKFRGQEMWGPLGIIVENPPYPLGTKCSWDQLK